jgi:hypothetical protein
VAAAAAPPRPAGIVRLLRDLDKQARAQGGAVYMLNGNHESLNVCGDFRYVTPGAFIEAAEEFGIPREVAVRNWDGCIQARAALYLPGGRIAKELSRNPTVLVVNDTAFAHGGLLPTHGERLGARGAWLPACGTGGPLAPCRGAACRAPSRTLTHALRAACCVLCCAAWLQ